MLLLGHLDTVVAHGDHRPLHRDGEKLVGSGSVDMKGGVVLSIGAMRAFAARPDAYAEMALLLVCDEEWRTGSIAHVDRFAGWDACLCFEGGDADADGDGRRGRAAQGGGDDPRRARTAAPRTRARRRTAAATRCWRWPRAAQAVAACHDPAGRPA